MSWQNFKTKYRLGNSDYFRWRQITDAIPGDWKIVIVRDIHDLSFEPGQHLLYLTRMRRIEKLSCNEIYNYITNACPCDLEDEVIIDYLSSLLDIIYKTFPARPFC